MADNTFNMDGAQAILVLLGEATHFENLIKAIEIKIGSNRVYLQKTTRGGIECLLSE